jgi:hypothetical protein
MHLIWLPTTVTPPGRACRTGAAATEVHIDYAGNNPRNVERRGGRRDRKLGERPGRWPRVAARFANLGQDPMQRRVVGLAAGPAARDAARALAPGGRRDS